MKLLPAEIKAQVTQWLGDAHEVLHFWEADKTYYICAVEGDCLSFLRVFSIGDVWTLSQDATKERQQ